jgi:hypothetical protein
MKDFYGEAESQTFKSQTYQTFNFYPNVYLYKVLNT